MPLTHLKVDKAKPKEKPYKLTDERGMYLLIHPKGGKWWRLDYRYQSKRKTLSLGTYPDVSIKVARKKRDDARSIPDGGVDPSSARVRSDAWRRRCIRADVKTDAFRQAKKRLLEHGEIDIAGDYVTRVKA